MIFLFDEIDFCENIFYSVAHRRRPQAAEASPMTTRDLIMETVRFYSIRMLVVHLKYLGESHAEFKRDLVDRFKATHPSETLAEYIQETFEGGPSRRR